MPGGLAGGMQVRHQDQTPLLRCSSHGTACAWVAVYVDRHRDSEHQGDPAAQTRQATSLRRGLGRPEDRQRDDRRPAVQSQVRAAVSYLLESPRRLVPSGKTPNAPPSA